uniref:4-galactosyl-N-acetylglucosaminide 3-alpha-L-fucosyltransferase FUT6-like n=1 Tax=Styela clava TaxID=7725 RepID=UPI00193A89CB|nr:4-galactosyl-N-acetylglucosaminide 3-alpha-L-fucosyltransferase FUT6-like [Styela clava]
MENEYNSTSLSIRCKIAVIIVTIFVLLEITTVSHWENKNLKYSPWNLNHQFWKSAYMGINPINISDIVLYNQRTAGLLSEKDKDELKIRLANATDKKVILVWIPGFGVKGAVSIDAVKCGNCEVTYDRDKLNDESTAAVIMHFDAIRPGNVPTTRNPNHLYIFWDMESTATLKVVRGVSLQFEDSIQFNASWTHRRDSSFHAPYGNYHTLTQILESNKLTPEELLKKKTKTAVAIVSNCAITPGAKTRIRLLQELEKMGFNLEGYGGCFGNKNFPNHGDKNYHDAVQKYKFYFAFENSYHCKDYITEKFFNNALMSNAVPVVWGPKRKDYEAIAPPGSFIHVDDFSSLKELANYIKYLDRNDTAYLEYLRWLTLKPSDMPRYGLEGGWCHICRALHGINVDDIYHPKYDPANPERPLFTKGLAPRTIKPSLSGWFYGEENPECFNT